MNMKPVIIFTILACYLCHDDKYMVSPKRILSLNNTTPKDGSCVVYVMSRDQRVRDNHALLAAQAEALEHKLPLVVVFNLYRSLGYRKREHFEFMVEGLRQVEQDLKKFDIPFVILIGDMAKNITSLAKEVSPHTIYFDFSPLRNSRRLQKKVASNVQCAVKVVDTHNIVPVWVTSDKEEFAAHTIRRKIHKLIEEWAVEPDNIKKHPHAIKLKKYATWAEVDKVVSNVPASGISHGFTSGEAAARKKLVAFISTGLDSYAADRNVATKDAQSDLSPYLHYGQLSSLRVLLDILDSSSHPPQLFTSFKLPSHDGTPTKSDGIDAFVEELVVRKELSDNFCFYSKSYDSLQSAKDWAQKTLHEHKDDPREHTYSKEDLRDAKTHDELWNAAQRQLTSSGKIHGYMRMYWAKKLLEWTNAPETALSWAIEFNDTYHLDGGDPNGYVGVMWSIAGVHDRPWFNREIFGTIRYMAESGVAKRFDTKEYVRQWQK